MNLLKIFNIKSKVQEESKPLTLVQDNIIDDKEYFICHYCNKKFEIIKSQIFPTPVPMINSGYMVQGQGIQCPHCLKTNIYN